MNAAKSLLVALFVGFACPVAAQSAYWVFLTDKEGVEFDPYAYFDPHAVSRYQRSGADLHHESNYPLKAAYVASVAEQATEVVGESRWLNAIGVVATADQAIAMANLPCVARVQPIEGYATLAAAPATADIIVDLDTLASLTDQLLRMGGTSFRQHGIDGSGVRIAVFDGGFPLVDKHEAFRHLRDGHRIIATWNFPNCRENVYGWNSHGTMTLSCITGMVGGKQLGLATGAEFLLARTEVETEPFKEEIWWQMAVEWADKHGADIISSSLGYGKERHYTTDMDGTSYVAKAANMAARKGILVCNSAGNEATSRQWRTIVTPSDADSALCIGGIEHSLTSYNHIYFSSYGPSADGRQKPNVCAFGNALTADTKSTKATHRIDGTSFSCPLVAGFAACAWQTRREATVMELFHLIEQSADLYPYADYAFGYGVPQASFFTGEAAPAAPTFRLVQHEGRISLQPLGIFGQKAIFYKESRPDRSIVRYGKRNISVIDSLSTLVFTIAPGNSLVAHFAGYTDSLVSTSVDSLFSFWSEVASREGALIGREEGIDYHHVASEQPSKWGSNAEWTADFYFLLGLPAKTSHSQLSMLAWSPAERIGVRVMHALAKPYRIGLGLEWGTAAFNYKGMLTNTLEQSLALPATIDAMQKVSHRRARLGEVSLEVFQRVRFLPYGIMGKGIHWDLGFYASYGYTSYSLKGKPANGIPASKTTLEYSNPSPLDAYRWNYGITTRFSRDALGLYARYRIGSLAAASSTPQVELPNLEIGLQILF
ncbi:MAG: S8 family serine peptidase [Bacteroidales bacterium]|nr:S8 family serine peptidase [Bacteroidales bacterium]